jgi:hypothetical protein
MLIKLGARESGGDVVDALLECHERIRRFAALAVTLAEARAPGAEEVREAAGQVRRYFLEALPLHVADEDESIVPRLRGRDAEVDAALATMSAEHEGHRAPLAELVSTCAALEAAPAAATRSASSRTACSANSPRTSSSRSG